MVWPVPFLLDELLGEKKNAQMPKRGAKLWAFVGSFSCMPYCKRMTGS